jgi:hypothetical protein
VVTSVPGWQAIATAYAAAVDRRLERAQLGRALAAALGPRRRGSPRDTVARLVAWLRREVRYVALSLDEAEVLPQRPETVLARRYGDCKDMATLLVGLIRAAGLQAHVALLAAGSGADTSPGFPGIEGFNHVIVVVPGATPLWIDPTARSGPASHLPVASQGRRALIARRGESQLVLTPSLPLAANRYDEVREIDFASFSGGRIVERTSARGNPAAELRAMLEDRTPAQFRQQLEGYAKETYGVPGLDRLVHDDPADPDRDAFRIQLEARRARRCYTDDVNASFPLDTGPLFQYLPKFLRQPPPAGDAAWARTRPLHLATPHTSELIYRLRRPPGYRLGRTFADQEVRLGPARIHWRLRRDVAPGQDELRLQLVMPKAVLGPEEVKAYFHGLKEAQALLEALELDYVHEGRQLLEAGEWARAAALYRSLRLRAPGDVTYQRQWAQLLLETGFADEARVVARAAVQAAPRTAAAHALLAWVHEHDRTGRRREGPWDRAAALAAYQEAVRLEPDEFFWRVQLAELLEHDAAGFRYSSDADCRRAATEWRAVKRLLDNDAYDNQLLDALHCAGDHAAVLELLADLPDKETYVALAVASTVATRGVASAAALLRRKETDEDRQRQLAIQAYLRLLRSRRYPEAAALVRAFVPTTTPAGKALQLLASARPAQFPAALPREPEALALQAGYWLYHVGPRGAAELGRLSSRAAAGELRLMQRAVQRALRQKLDERFGPIGLLPDTLADFLLASSRAKATGDPTVGYRVRVEVTGGDDTSYSIYLVPEDGGLRVLAVAPALSALGRAALARIDRGELAVARTWLGWAALDAVDAPPLATFRAVFRPDAGIDALRAAAVILAGTVDEPDAGTVSLLRAHLAGRAPLPLRQAVERALLEVHRQRSEWSEVVRLGRRLGGAAAKDPEAAKTFLHALVWANRIAEARAAVRTRFRTPQEAAEVAYIDRMSELRAGRFDAMIPPLVALIHQKDPPVWARRLRVIAEHCRPQGNPGVALVEARTAAGDLRKADRGSLHLLALASASAGKPAEAHAAYLRYLQASDRDEPRPGDDFLRGRIAEAAGLPELARPLYQRVPKPSWVEPCSEWERARTALGRLGATSP